MSLSSMIQQFSPLTTRPPLVPVVLVSFLVIVAYYVVPFLSRRSIAYLQGPDDEVDNWLLGNVAKFFTQRQVGDLDFAWIKKYGSVLRLKGPFGDDTLFVADPKAIQYIYHTSAYNYVKPPSIGDRQGDVLGRGLFWAHGSAHQRQRKLLQPAFSTTQLRGFLPVFQQSATDLTQRWRALLANQEPNEDGSKPCLNVMPWLNRTTLDALGYAAFDYPFHALEGEGSEPITAQLRTLALDLDFQPSTYVQLSEFAKDYHPSWLLDVLRRIPSQRMARMKSFTNTTYSIAKDLMTRADPEGGRKDILSVLARANAVEEGAGKLPDDELYSQLGTLMLAGTATSANTIVWALNEFAMKPKLQDEVRAEITKFREKRVGEPFEMSDMEGMKLAEAVIKETLRLYPIQFHMTRTSTKDDVIPLSVPVITKTGEKISAIPVGKNQKIVISLQAYNRLPEVWGEDAHEFKPHRFLDENYTDKAVKIGVTSNIMSFSAGVKACIGWRFALIEMQAILVQLVENFRFYPPESFQGKRIPQGEKVNVLMSHLGGMTPLVEGQLTMGPNMPLTVEAIE